jgi:hypothetical protein
MTLRRKLFIVWCSFTVLWLLWGIVSEGGMTLLKFRAGGWRAAYVHFTVTVLIALAGPAVILLLGRIVFWSTSRLNRKAED